MSFFWKFILKIISWKCEISVSIPDKTVICVAPHTSNWDFILGLVAYRAYGRKANFLMKEFWFFFPLKYLLYYFGGIPVKKGGNSLTQSLVEKFKSVSYLNLAVTPEGTRKSTTNWRTGFLYIANGANVPITLAVIDYKNKIISINDIFYPSGNIEEDMAEIKKFYAGKKELAKFPEKFIV